MIQPEGYQWATQAHLLLTEEVKTLGYFKSKIVHKDHLGNKYSLIKLFKDDEKDLGFVYVHENANSGLVFAEFRYVKARASTLFTGKVVPTKVFPNNAAGQAEFPQWVVERFSGAPNRPSTTTNFFAGRSVAKVKSSEESRTA